MTDESQGIDPVEEQAAPVESQPEPIVTSGAGEFTSGEGLVAFAGILVIGVWLVFDILATEYFVDSLTMLLAVAAAVSPRVRRASVERIAPLAAIMKTIGYAIAVLGVIALIEDVRYELLDEVWAVIGGIIFYAAAVMAYIGARQIKI
jgi:hypothetical protein